jgi:gas vesicle protein
MSEDNDIPYIVIEKRQTSFAAFIWGAALGAATALLFAPKSGEETQQDIREGVKRLRDEAETRITSIRGDIERRYDATREEVGERIEAARGELVARKEQAERAVRAGREAAKKARTDLEKRVEETKAAYRGEMTAESVAAEEDD